MKSLTILILLLQGASGIAQEACHVYGTVEPFSDGIAILIHAVTRDTISKATIENHRFDMIVSLDRITEAVTPSFVICSRDDQKMSVAGPVALEKTPIELTVKEAYVLGSGSEIQDNFSRFVEEMTDLDSRLSARAKLFSDSERLNALSAKLDSFFLEHRHTDFAFFATVVMLDQLARRTVDPASLTGITALCQSSVPDSNDLKICQAIEQFNKNWAGIHFMDFTGNLTNGSIYHFNDHVGRKPIIIDFWASWCGPCIEDFPMLMEMHSSGDIEIIGISIDANEASWLRSIEHHGLPWPNIRDADGRIKKLYDVTSVPTKLVVNKAGMIVARNPESLAAVLKSLE